MSTDPEAKVENDSYPCRGPRISERHAFEIQNGSGSRL